ncbi:MAG: VTT domain-containing protein [Sandaracinus sp.]|nr:VTT domain-containing protein [Sandaracinus sp.]
MDDVVAYLQSIEGPSAYLALLLAAMVEYVVPPLPGDTFALAGIALAATAGYSPWLVHAALTLGATIGGQLAWGFGRYVRVRRERSPGFLHGPRTERALDEVRRRFETHGAIYLLANRFVPALRAFFFVGAGLSGMPGWKVALYGGLSAAAWNALLLAAGWALGANLDRLGELVQHYTWIALGLVLLGVGVALWRMRRARTKT